MKKIIFCSLLSISTSLFATAEIQQMQKDLQDNANKYCSEGVKSACDVKESLANPSKADPTAALKKMSKEDQLAFAEMMKKMQSCGQDMNCLTNIQKEEAAKALSKLKKGCEGGEKEACFLHRHTEITQKALGSL